MQLPHGNTKVDILKRVSARAVALTTGEFTTEADLHDPTDINAGEDKEIEFSKSLAAEWRRGNAIEAWYLPGFNTFAAAQNRK